MSEESLVALMIGRPLQLAFPERHGAGRGPRGAPRGLRACTASGSGRSTSRSRRARSSGSPAPRATGRCSSSARSPESSAPPAARPATAASSTRGRRVGPLRAGVVLLSGDRARESLFPVLSVRANTTIQVLRRLGRLGFLNRRRERDTVGELGGRLGIRMASIEQPVQSLSGGNQQKVSLTRPFLRGNVKRHPRRGADPGRRRRRPLRHLRRAAGEGEGGRRDRSSSRAIRSSWPGSATASSSCRAGRSSTRSAATSSASAGSSRRSSARA